jgi:hypothetical protein
VKYGGKLSFSGTELVSLPAKRKRRRREFLLIKGPVKFPCKVSFEIRNPSLFNFFFLFFFLLPSMFGGSEIKTIIEYF